MSSSLRRLVSILGLSVPLFSGAAVVRVELTQRTDLGSSGYEQLTGRLHFEIDPVLPQNAIIADVGLAPLNAAGRVAFHSDLRILRPKDASRANGTVWFEIPNRGGRASLSDWITQNGFTVVNVGWEFDVPAGPDKLRLEAPRARHPDRPPLTGVVRAVFTPDKRKETQPLTDLADYPAVNPTGPDSQLIVRTRAAFPGGEVVPRHLWQLEEGLIRLTGGFEPGRTYEVAYLSEGPPIAGLGYAAIRDAVPWLRHGTDSPVPVRHALAFGSSQCGRFLRDFLYLGFNTDEAGRAVLDGVIAHVAGAGRLVLNERWSTPRALAGYHTASYPFADSAQPDPVSGHTEGILDNPRVRHAPKVFAINMAAEYWGAGRVAALTHTDPAGRRDIELPANVRSYFFACTSHGPSSFPPTAQTDGAPLANPVNANPAVIALRLALHRWVAEKAEPPPSVHPCFADGTLVPASQVRFPAVPGLASPAAATAGVRVRNPQWSDGAGAGTELPLLVPQVDADGNDLGGIRMPDIAVPLGTGTGWVFRPAAYGSPGDFYLLRGAWVPLAATQAARLAMGDSRPSLEERYGSRSDFLRRIEAAVRDLIARGFLLPNDLEPQLKQAGDRWDWIQRGR